MWVVGTGAGEGTGGEGAEMGTEAGSTGTLGTGSAHSHGTPIINKGLLQTERFKV